MPESRQLVHGRVLLQNENGGDMDGEVLRVTYIAWQGWCLESPRARLLIDPLLVDEVGRGPKGARVNFMFRTPRQFEFGALGPVDAVYLSHEHEDHFNIATLARLDRRIPVIISGLMSDAGRTILAEMGFQVDCVWSGDARVIGDVEIQFFGPNHRGTGETDEWDTTAYLVRQRDGLGVFASNVDIPIGPNLKAALDAERSKGIEPVVFSNMMVAPWGGGDLSGESSDENPHRPTKPATHDPEADLAAFRRLQPFTPFPGEVLVLKDGAVNALERRARFLRSLPGQSSVLPFSNPEGQLGDPVTGRKALDRGRKADLEDELRRFAEHLYGGSLFQLLMSIGNDAIGERRTFVMAFVIDDQGNEWVYEYRPRSCDFAQIDKTSEGVEDYLGALLMWATDFLAVASGEIEPRVLGRSIVEARADDRVPVLAFQLWRFYHPLRFPRRVLQQYRKALALEEGAPICVLPGTSYPSTTLDDQLADRPVARLSNPSGF